MAGVSAAVALLVLAVALLASVNKIPHATASEGPRCCVDFHAWGERTGNTGCPQEMNETCNTWCQSSCRGGECKKRGDRHFCHCYC